jgi:hypothetical protein
MVQAARLHLDNDFARCRMGFGQFAQFKCAGSAVCDELNGFHGDDSTPLKEDGQEGSARE